MGYMWVLKGFSLEHFMIFCSVEFRDSLEVQTQKPLELQRSVLTSRSLADLNIILGMLAMRWE